MKKQVDDDLTYKIRGKTVVKKNKISIIPKLFYNRLL